MGVVNGPTASIRQPIEADPLIPVPDLVARLSRDPVFPTQLSHSFAFQETRHELHPLVHEATLLPRHRGVPPCHCRKSVTYVSGMKCYLCLGKDSRGEPRLI